MPLEWVVQGYAGAVRRFHDAEGSRRAAEANEIPSTAREASIALFEASTWIDSLIEQLPDFAGDPRVRAFVFVRQRIHHNWAAAIFFDPDKSTYVWRPESNFPIPREERHRNPKGERRYAELLAGRPVHDVVLHLERRVIALAAKA
jgi:hypothetical protein